MFNNIDNTQHDWLEDLLADQADALIGEEKFEGRKLAPGQAAEANELLDLAVRVSESLKPVAPSEEFLARLRVELAGQAQVTLLVPSRKSPPHYQLATKLGGLTITAGIRLLAPRP